MTKRIIDGVTYNTETSMRAGGGDKFITRHHGRLFRVTDEGEIEPITDRYDPFPNEHRVTLRLPRLVYEAIAALAEKEGESLNTYITRRLEDIRDERWRAEYGEAIRKLIDSRNNAT
jgi:hypothetical protein